MQAPKSSLVRRILRNHPQEAYKLTQASREGVPLLIIDRDGEKQYLDSSATRKMDRDRALVIDLREKEFVAAW